MAMNPRLLRPRASGGFDPRSISGCVCNLDASVLSSLFQNSDGTTAAAATDNPVGYWADLSGLGNHAKQTVATGSRPFLKLNNQNGRPGLLLDGSNDFLTATIGGLNSLSNVTIIQVFKSAVAAAADTASGNYFGFGNAGSASSPYPASRSIAVAGTTGALAGEKIAVVVEINNFGRLGSSTYSRQANSAHFLLFSFGAGGTAALADGNAVNLDQTSLLTTATASGPSSTGYTLDNDLHIGALRVAGALAVSSVALTIHQMIVYNRTLTATEQDTIWSAMRGKWGIT